MKRSVFLCVLSCSLGLSEAVFATPAKQVIVGPDDTVYGIAYNNGIPTRALISANNLKAPYALSKGQVLIIPAPNEHVVGTGESLQTIAEEYGVKVDVLAQENGISSPFFVKQGDHLTIPSRDTESLSEALQPNQKIMTSSLAPLPLVKTLPADNKASSSSSSLAPLPTPQEKPSSPLPEDLAAELAQEKGALKAPSTPGSPTSAGSLPKPVLMGNLAQKNAGAPITPLVDSIDVEKETKKPKKEAKKDNNNDMKENKEKESKKEESDVKKDQKEVKKEESPRKEKEEEIKTTLFIWPVEGKVIGKFASGGKNDGINIKVPEGTSVKAAADGEVMYSGSELKGFGNLLLIKHAEGWMTAYAHNSELLVTKGDKVKQGDTIAKSGKTGDVNEPQLHFEVRKGKQPIDPLTKLES
ncbi:MAG: LysM peptidoglycan-binding domain-containing M23 family metallopeptidase [Alphaproteobacteria bacterium]|nr:LysM peptidoglycan-binding domain-containing M23 family metallopeptidase [Alphaproteobacteria bacterium]